MDPSGKAHKNFITETFIGEFDNTVSEMPANAGVSDQDFTKDEEPIPIVKQCISYSKQSSGSQIRSASLTRPLLRRTLTRGPGHDLQQPYIHHL